MNIEKGIHYMNIVELKVDKETDNEDFIKMFKHKNLFIGLQGLVREIKGNRVKVKIGFPSFDVMVYVEKNELKKIEYSKRGLKNERFKRYTIYESC